MSQHISIARTTRSTTSVDITTGAHPAHASAGSSTTTDLPPSRKLQRILPAVAPKGPRSPTDVNPTPETAHSPIAITRKERRTSSVATSSRSAREAARKSNHSRIEKLRREKINDALASLRELVPHPDVGKEGTSESGSVEKEFKLDILERTVTYLVHLQEKLKVLEERDSQEADLPSICSRCGDVIEQDDGSGIGGARVLPCHSVTSSQPVVGNEDEDMEDAGPAPVKKAGHSLMSLDRLCSTHLPLLEDLAASPTMTEGTLRTDQSVKTSFAVSLPSISTFAPPSSYLPLSPPGSGRSRPVDPMVVPPMLTLPTASLSKSASSLSPHHATTPARSIQKTLREDGQWTPDDETAASLLVHLSAKSTSEKTSRSQAHTPASLLGLLNPVEGGSYRK